MADTKTANSDTSNIKDFPSKSEADARLRSFIERVERLEAEKAELAEDIKEV